MVFEVIITTDRTMMTNHHGKEFLGFITTAPPVGMPERLWMYICAPKMKVDSLGRPKEAPYGLRKIESVLLDAGFNVAIVDPDHLVKHVNTAKVLLIGHHDYFGYGPPSSEWWSITQVEPANRRSFIRFMNSQPMRAMREKGVKIIVGGPAAWQWLYEVELIEKWGINTIVDGEGEKVVVDLVKRALEGKKLPRFVYVGVDNVPRVDEIPLIKGASVNGLVEIMRGCPRGCKFCSVTLRPLRFIPMERILAEIDVNLRANINGVLLHSEDVLLYYADGIKPRPEPIIKLHKEILKKIGEEGQIGWAHLSLAALKYAEENFKLISQLMHEYILGEHRRFVGVEVGIETGSPELAERVMYAKSLPYNPKEWPNIVEDAFRIMHENMIIPAATIILGLPEETPNDVIKTIELVERLKPYRSILVPMFFVPMGAFKKSEWFLRDHLKPEHIDALLKIYEHTVYWVDNIMDLYLASPAHIPLKLLLKMLVSFIKRNVHKYRALLEETIKR